MSSSRHAFHRIAYSLHFENVTTIPDQYIISDKRLQNVDNYRIALTSTLITGVVHYNI